ncbi:MAG: YlxR family protein [Clostridia bacterium]|nr:YlxR family protein [Clostridia bacterium]
MGQGTEKKIPERKCIGCGQKKPKGELCRIVRTPEGEIIFDSTGKKSGRGAYLCPDVKCLAKARKAKRLSQALDCPVSDDIYQILEGEYKALCQ